MSLPSALAELCVRPAGLWAIGADETNIYAAAGSTDSGGEWLSAADRSGGQSLSAGFIGGNFGANGPGSIGRDDRHLYRLEERNGSPYVVASAIGTASEVWSTPFAATPDPAFAHSRSVLSLVAGDAMYVVVHSNAQGCHVSFGD